MVSAKLGESDSAPPQKMFPFPNNIAKKNRQEIFILAIIRSNLVLWCG
jgi:hypothetical protein